eukprot:11082649-Karenia_brevis.AAC.1
MALHRKSNVARHSSRLDGATVKPSVTANTQKRVAWADSWDSDNHSHSGKSDIVHADDGDH